jgi:plasmid stabilization system protein ParE
MSDEGRLDRASLGEIARNRGIRRARQSGSGRRLPELPDSDLRELLVGNYRVVYRRRAKRIEVLALFEGHRLLRESELTEE